MRFHFILPAAGRVLGPEIVKIVILPAKPRFLGPEIGGPETGVSRPISTRRGPPRQVLAGPQLGTRILGVSPESCQILGNPGNPGFPGFSGFPGFPGNLPDLTQLGVCKTPEIRKTQGFAFPRRFSRFDELSH